MMSLNSNKNNMILQQTDTLRCLRLFYVIAYKNAEDTKKDNQNSYWRELGSLLHDKTSMIRQQNNSLHNTTYSNFGLLSLWNTTHNFHSWHLSQNTVTVSKVLLFQKIWNNFLNVPATLFIYVYLWVYLSMNHI